ncbi:hypothetical protein TrVE_jg6114 [Triparma verrucosa]|uniref:Glycosyl transferase family 1 domain-containing protein n=1 Tax=Triparma verrucosa TaxID=1606542 RepID=A0A9W7EUU4_9STRA|nr:hypothetical protein TrVE_jg6114 [Triparma verrucosa]
MRFRRAFVLYLCFILATLNLASLVEDVNVRIRWCYPAFSGGGYSSEGTTFVLALAELLAEKNNWSVTIAQHGDGFNRKFLNGLDDETRNALQALSAKDYERELNSFEVSICHSEPGAWNVLGGPRWNTPLCPPSSRVSTRETQDERQIFIGRTMFETDRLPDGWEGRTNAMDEVWVPSAFSERIFKDGGVTKPVFVLGEGVDTDFFDPAKAGSSFDHLKPNSDTFVLLSVFKFEERKGYDVLLDTYFGTFTHDDDVLLLLLISDYHGSGSASLEAYTEKMGYDSETGPKIKVVYDIPQNKLPDLYAAADAFVLPSRGEGWGRPHVEAMSMEIPIIVTNFSGPTEFITEENSFPIKVEEMVELKEGAFRGHQWAEPSRESLSFNMAMVFRHRQVAVRRGKQARQDMIERFAPKIIAQEVIDRVEMLVTAKILEGKRRGATKSSEL